jgi:hypothetical protein
MTAEPMPKPDSEQSITQAIQALTEADAPQRAYWAFVRTELLAFNAAALANRADDAA